MARHVRFRPALVMIGLVTSQLACFPTSPPPSPPAAGAPEVSSAEGESEGEPEAAVAEATTPTPPVRPPAVKKAEPAETAADALAAFRVPEKWGVTPDPSAQPTEIKATADASVAIAIPSGDVALFPSTPSAFVAVGQNRSTTDVREVWDLRSVQRTGTIKGQVEGSDSSPAALSPDGRFYVAEARPTGTIEVWSTETGALVRRIDLKPTPTKLVFLDFAAPGQVIVAMTSRDQTLIQVLDFQSGGLVRGFAAPSKLVEKSLELSPGRKYLALAADDRVIVYDLAGGSPAGAVGLPRAASVMELRFSPDGTELAGLFNGSQLLVWDVAKGEQTTALDVPGILAYRDDLRYIHKGPEIEWVPDGSAWLLRGFELLDRDSGLMVWTIRSATGQYTKGPRRFLDTDHLLVVAGSLIGAKRLEGLTLPWPQVDAALKAMRSDSPAYLRPGETISLQVEVAGVRFGSPEPAKTELVEALTAALAGREIQVADGRPVVLQVRYAEAPGRSATFRRFGPGASPTNTTVQTTKTTAEFTLKATGLAKPLWTHRMESGESPGMIVHGEPTDSNMRDTAFKEFTDRLRELPLPYFIPKGDAVSRLPGETVVTPGPGPRPTRPGPARPTRRGLR